MNVNLLRSSIKLNSILKTKLDYIIKVLLQKNLNNLTLVARDKSFTLKISICYVTGSHDN